MLTQLFRLRPFSGMDTETRCFLTSLKSFKVQLWFLNCIKSEARIIARPGITKTIKQKFSFGVTSVFFLVPVGLNIKLP